MPVLRKHQCSLIKCLHHPASKMSTFNNKFITSYKVDWPRRWYFSPSGKLNTGKWLPALLKVFQHLAVYVGRDQKHCPVRPPSSISCYVYFFSAVPALFSLPWKFHIPATGILHILFHLEQFSSAFFTYLFSKLPSDLSSRALLLIGLATWLLAPD